MKIWGIVTLCATLIVGCGGGNSSASNNSTTAEASATTTAVISLTSEEQAAVSRYVVDADHVNTSARNCAAASIVKNVGTSRMDEFTKGAAATEKRLCYSTCSPAASSGTACF
jgi:hypothetical protein